ncbi:MAG: hypothetical protein AB1439_07805 [candidate division FCPU426 bacterium]
MEAQLKVLSNKASFWKLFRLLSTTTQPEKKVLKKKRPEYLVIDSKTKTLVWPE